MKGQWITAEKTEGTVRFIKRFNLDKIEGMEKAEIDVCGLGYFTLLINGKRVSEDLFTPAQTDYAPRDLSKFNYPLFDEISHRTLYLSYDVKDYLKSGENLIEVICGGGWYVQPHRKAEGKVDYSDKMATCFSLSVDFLEGDKLEIHTDGSETYSLYPILFSNLFFGEFCDTRLFGKVPQEFPVALSEFLPENLKKQTCPPDRVIRKIKPTLISENETRRLYDCGENISGLVELYVKGAEGNEITLRFAEVMQDGELFTNTTGSDHKSAVDGRPQLQKDTFILNGEEQTLCPQFVWHCFRYFELQGEAEILEPTALVIHTDMKIAAEFSCDNDILNWLYDAYIRTQLNSTHGSIPMDCPHRERLGYTGDGQICANAGTTIFESAEMYKKWIDDILDCQNKLNGHVQHTAPLMGGGGGPGGWGSAIVEVPYQHYRHFGDIELLKKCYEPQKKWIEYMLSRSENGLVVREEEKGWCLGDWCVPKTDRLSKNPNPIDLENLPEPFVNTCYLIFCLKKMVEIAEVLGKIDDIPYFEGRIKACQTALEEEYMESGQFFMGSHGADAYGLRAEIGDKDTLLKGLIDRYENAPCLDTGMFGIYFLPEVLFQCGRGDIAVSLLASEDTEIGYNHMKSAGATTLWECIDNDGASNCHPMFGAPAALLFEGLLGIKPKSFKSGYSEVVIRPCLNSKVKKAEGSLETGWGKISVRFQVEFDKTCLTVEIPKGIAAHFQNGETLTPLTAGTNEITL